MQNDNRNINKRIRVTEKEHEHIKEQALACGLTVSEYVRRKTLGRKIPDVVLQQILYKTISLHSRAKSLKGLMKHLYNENSKYGMETAHALQVLEDICKDCRKIISYMET